MSSIYRQMSPLRDALSENESDGRHMIDVHTRQLEAIRARDHERLEQVLQETFVDLEAEFRVETPYRFRWLQKSPDVDEAVRTPDCRRGDRKN